MTVAFILIKALSTVAGLDTFDLEKKNLLQVQVDRKLQSPRGTIYDPQWQALGDERSYKIFICGPYD